MKPVSFARTPSVDFAGHSHHDRAVLDLLVLLFRAIALACRGHQDVVLENLALRHQLRTLRRTVKRPHLRTRDRMFWVLFGDRLASVAVRVGRRPTRDSRSVASRLAPSAMGSARRRSGRPALDPHVRGLIAEMASGQSALGSPARPWRTSDARD
jgi:hypothetical protein